MADAQGTVRRMLVVFRACFFYPSFSESYRFRDLADKSGKLGLLRLLLIGFASVTTPKLGDFTRL